MKQEHTMDRAYTIFDWPVKGDEARKAKQLYRIKQDEMLHLVGGLNKHILYSFFVSNDFINFGKMTIPSGIYSDAECHNGDEVLFVEEGTLIVRVFDGKPSEENERTVLNEAFEIKQGEKFFLPNGKYHKYFNFTGKNVIVVFAIAPVMSEKTENVNG